MNAQRNEMLKLIEITSQTIKRSNISIDDLIVNIHTALDDDILKIVELNKQIQPEFCFVTRSLTKNMLG